MSDKLLLNKLIEQKREKQNFLECTLVVQS